MSSKIKSLSIVMITFIVLLLTGCNNNAVSFEINFDSNGGSIVESVNYDGSSTVTIPDNPTKEGFIFDGWYWDNETFDNPFTANSLLDTPIEDDITLYAKWNINTYTLTFKDYDDTVLYEESYDYNTDLSELVVEDPSREGYTFNGWDQVIPLTMPENDVLIKATYTINQYTIIFDSNEGTSVESITQDYDTEVIEPSEPTREGYTFGGWYIDEALTTVYTFTNIPAEDITLYAKWDIQTYTITYLDYDDTEISSAKYYYREDLSEALPADPKRTGYTFEGWDNSLPLSMPAEDITIKASYSINQYTITFDSNEGSVIEPIMQDYDANVSEPTMPTKEGYEFGGWFSDEALTKAYKFGTMPAENITLYAKWVAMYEYFTIDNMTYVYYGEYPQTVVTDSELISELDTLTSTNTKGYYEYQGNEYAKLVAINNIIGYNFSNGHTINSGQTYYFKVEPIKWRVLENEDGTYTLLSEYIIDTHEFDTSTNIETNEWGSKYPNNYRHSTIRYWLNNGFYYKAFSASERMNVITTVVDNSVITTNSYLNPYASENTNDKVYLLSYQESISTVYGFDQKSSRTATTTDYARAKGIFMSIYGNANWWLRSPYYSNTYHYDSITANFVSIDGSINYYALYVYHTNVGVRPVLRIE